MITHISINDYAIIDDIDIEPEAGLNIITGETGAGKSIIIEAISLAFGSRADTTMVREGSKKARIQVVFDGEDVVSREVSKSGKSISKINGEIVNLSELNRFCSRLVDIHGQYDHQSLLDSGYHIKILDLFNSAEIEPLAAETARCYREYSAARGRLTDFETDAGAIKREMNFMQFELDEIRRLNPVVGEDEELEESINVLKHSEKIFSRLSSAYALLDSSSLGSAKNDLDEISDLSKELRDFDERLNDVFYNQEDIKGEIRDYLDSIDYSEQVLNASIERLDHIERIKGKHGVKDIEALLGIASELERKLGFIEDADHERERLTEESSAAKQSLMEVSDRLSEVRRNTASSLETRISAELSDLSFSNTAFSVKFEAGPPTESGIDRVEFLISPNRGLPMLPLSKIASGGEMSRIMLAFKSVLGSYDNIETMIFDEIDSGISGKTASIVGDKMKSMSESHQIICITHLPQIAACSHTHFKIQKRSDSDSTYTTVVMLDDAEHIEEVARLLGGKDITEHTLNNARDLISASKPL